MVSMKNSLPFGPVLKGDFKSMACMLRPRVMPKRGYADINSFGGNNETSCSSCSLNDMFAKADLEVLVVKMERRALVSPDLVVQSI